jgi:hypothetical protein
MSELGPTEDDPSEATAFSESMEDWLKQISNIKPSWSPERTSGAVLGGQQPSDSLMGFPTARRTVCDLIPNRSGVKCTYCDVVKERLVNGGEHVGVPVHARLVPRREGDGRSLIGRVA